MTRLNKQAIIPNILLDTQKELNMTDSELILILKIFNMDKSVIPDSDLGNCKIHPFGKLRKSLKKKNLINFEQIKDSNGNIAGYVYDISGLKEKLNAISNKI
jgi:hypothetical protein